MKRISHPLLLSIFLASCANVVSQTTVVTETSVPTAILVFTDTPQPTPTETPDPNMPADATGQDNEGNYTKKAAENGEKVTLTWFAIQYGDDADKSVVGHWFELLNKDGKEIYLITNALSTSNNFLHDSIPFSLYRIENHQQLTFDFTIRHPDQTSEFGPDTSLHGESHSSKVLTYLRLRYFDLKNSDDMTDAQYSEYYTKMQNDGLSISVEGEDWLVSKGYREVLVDYTLAAKDPTFRKTDNFYWKIMVIDKQLVCLIATPEVNKLSDQDLRIMMFAPLWEVLLQKSLPENIKSFYGGVGRVSAAEFSLLGGTGVNYENVQKQPTTDFIEIDYLE